MPLCLLAILLPMAGVLSAPDPLSSLIFNFIYRNEQICGDQFVDPNWLPALGKCEVDCDLITEICQMSTGSAAMRTQRLPNECVSQLRETLTANVPKTTTPEATEKPPVTTERRRLSGRTSNINTFDLSVTPTFADSVLDDYTDSEPFSTDISLDAFDLSEGSTKSAENEEFSTNQFLEAETTQNPQIEENSVSENDKKLIDEFFQKTFPEMTAVPIPVVPIPSDRSAIQQRPDDETIFDPVIFETPNTVVEVEAEEETTTPPTTKWPQRHHFDDWTTAMPTVPTPPPEVHIFGPPFIDTPEPPNLPQRSHLERHHFETNQVSKHPFPLSWRELAGKLKKRPLYTMESQSEIDQSVRCCQWALDGLCDRSWQRVRALCPKSCGTVVCSSVDGALSCNRAIDVDVIDCYERRKARAHGSTNRVLSSATFTLSDDDDNDDIPFHRQSNAISQRAFAVENEIRSFPRRIPFG